MHDHTGPLTETRDTDPSSLVEDALGHDADLLVTALLTASRVLVGVSARSLDEVEHSVSLTQFRTLVVLESRAGTNLAGLAEALAVNASTALRTVDRLVAAGLVDRRDNPKNRREVQLGLTPDGSRLVDTVTARRREEIARVVSAMPAESREDLVDALRAFADAAREPDAALLSPKTPATETPGNTVRPVDW